MLMADRTDQRPEPRLPAPDDALAIEVEIEVHDELLAGGEAEEPDAQDASTANETKEEPEPLPPAEIVSAREIDAFLRQLYSTRALTCCVRGRVQDPDVEDVVQEALIAVKRLKRLPKGEKERLQYARAIARNKAISWYTRKEKKRDKEVAFDDARGEAVACSRLEGAIHGEQLDKMADTVPLKQRATLACLARHLLMGESLAEMAREMGVEYDTFYKRVTTLQRQMKEAGKVLGGLVMMLVVLTGAWRVLEPSGDVAAPAPSSWTGSPPPSERPAETPAPGSPEALQKARELREQAFRACTQDDWASCERGLDGARELDPQGESDLGVQAARADVQAAAKHGEGTGWSPKRPRAYDEGAR
jgi:RNA polymerase sigma factor (sigma-70 family)